MATVVPHPKEVINSACSQECKTVIQQQQTLIEQLTKEAGDERYETYLAKKELKPLKAKLEATVKDYRKLQEVFSSKCQYFDDNLKKLNEVTAELEELKAKFGNANFNFKKYDVSSKVVESMIEKQLKWQGKRGQGVGYESVPPPFNDNYTATSITKEEEEREKHLQYGMPAVNQSDDVKAPTSPESVRTDDQKSAGSSTGVEPKPEEPNDSTPSTSCVDEVVVESQTESCVGSNSKTLNVPPACLNFVKPSTDGKTEKYVPPKPVAHKFKTEKPHHCGCGNLNKQVAHGPHMYSEPGMQHQIHEIQHVKRQTCYNCGIPGHIARNCPYRPYVPYYFGQSQRAGPWSNKRNDQKPKAKPSDRDWRQTKVEGEKPMKRKRKNKNQKRKSKVSPTTQTEPILKEPKKTFSKPKYAWLPKSVASQSSSSSKSSNAYSSSSSIFDSKEDMSWQEVTYVDAQGNPKTFMTWVPMSN